MTVSALNRSDSRHWDTSRFSEFTHDRPDDERWQLVDGLAMMMTPTTLVHQKLSKRLLRLLDHALETNRPDLEAFFELGLRIEGFDDFEAIPDILVIDADATFERYAERVYLVAEIISPSNTAEMIERKLDLYQSHPDNLYCLTVDQDAVHIALFTQEGGWVRVDLRALDDRLVLPAFGLDASLSEIYADTLLTR